MISRKFHCKRLKRYPTGLVLKGYYSKLAIYCTVYIRECISTEVGVKKGASKKNLVKYHTEEKAFGLLP